MENASTTPSCLPGAVFPIASAEHTPRTKAGRTITTGLPPGSDEDARLAEFLGAVERCRPRLLWLATRIINRREDAEDVVQQAYLKAFANLSRFRGESQMTTWLQVIVQNAAREYVRNQRGRVLLSLECPPNPEDGHETCNLPDTGMSPEEQCERRERETALAAAIGGMGPANRKVLELCLIEELPYAEIAATLNMSVAAVKSRMFRSRRDLRIAISDHADAIC